MRSKAIGVMILWTLCSTIAQAQNVDSLTRQYPGEMAVYTDYKENLVLEFEKGQLKARTETEWDMLLLNDNAGSFFNSARVYHSYFNRLKDITGTTLVPTGKGWRSIEATQIKTRPSESESVFYDDAKETEITFTHLQKGARTHLSHTLLLQENRMLPKFFFQNNIPTLRTSFSITYPKGVDIAGIMQGMPVDWIKKTTEESRKTITVTWTAVNVPKARVFADAPRFSYYSPHLVIFIRSYTDPRSGEKVAMLDNIPDLNRFLFGFVKNINAREDKDIAAKVSELTKDAASDNEKTAAIYKWVQNNIRYVAFEDSLGGFIPREAATVYHRRFGDCKDMSSLLCAMCRAAGLDARYVWVGTRSIPYTFNTTPIPGLFNHMICAAKTDGKWTFLDGTDPVLPYGAIPQALQGKEALIGNTADDYEVVKIPVIGSDISQVIDSSFVQIKDNNISGQVAIQLTGYNAWDTRIILKYKNENEKEKTINAITQRGSNKYAQKQFDYKIPDEPLKSVRISAGFEIPDYVRKAGKDYYINLNLLRSLSGSKVDMTDRNAPLEKDFNETNKQVVVMDIPKGYKVSYLPEPKQQTIEGIGAYSIRYNSDGKKVTLSKEIRMDALYIQPDHFKDFNSMVSGLQNAYKETVVLTAE
jgi:transglutaminase-like putative cysteine protease